MMIGRKLVFEQVPVEPVKKMLEKREKRKHTRALKTAAAKSSQKQRKM
jgi:hypothetical protein